jgi:hypothetical protein
MRLGKPGLAACLLGLSLGLVASPSWALDKQGSAHGGKVEEAESSGFNVSGALSLGSAIINSSYAARPDNTGLALFRYAGHADVDLIGRKLSIPLDINFFTDRERKGLKIFLPTELDVIGGVTSTNSLGAGDLEVGARVEKDLPVDQGTFSQTYADVRARYLYSLAKLYPKLAHELVDGDISGYFTLGWFAINPTYAARPNNTGLALFRYVAHTELSVVHDYVSIGVDTTFFTNRGDKNNPEDRSPLIPTELDFTYEFILRKSPFELHIAYERDMPLDQRTLIQDYVYALFVYGFDLKKKVEPLETRGTIPSP